MDHAKICKIRDLYRAISALERRFERLYDLNINEVMLLCTLRESGCMTSSELAEQLDLTPSNASKVIASVERLGFVSRARCKQDKRQMYFSLTAAGGERLAYAERLFGKSVVKKAIPSVRLESIFDEIACFVISVRPVLCPP